MTDIEAQPWVQLDGMLPAPIAEAIFAMLREVGGWEQDRTGPEPVLTLTHHQLDGAYLEWNYRDSDRVARSGWPTASSGGER